jgi:outer membrane receptor protein involved in Fe transport
LAISAPAAAWAQAPVFDVPAQPASRGVRLLARQAGIQIIVAGTAASGRSTNAVQGRMGVRAALERLLAGSGLTLLSFDGRVAVLGPAPTQVEEAAPEPIVVTGTRIARLELDSVMPLSVIDIAESRRLGRNSAYDALMREPAVAPGVGLTTAFGQEWDAGVGSVSLRNLGANRSLTLIDGMRRVSGSARSSAVDINMIPAAMIERIDIITGGATAIYGADAVTGAINIVTRSDVEDLEYAATSGISQQGDASEVVVSLATGGTFAGGRGRGVLGGTYSRTAPLGFSQRYDKYVRNIANPLNNGAEDGIPDQITVPDFRQIYFAYEPTFFHQGQSYIVENGVPRIAGYEETLWPGEFSYGDGGDGRNLRDADQLRGGLEAIALMGRLEYALSDVLEYGATLEYGRTWYEGTASFPLHRDDSRPTWFGGAGGSVATLDNPFVPPAVRSFMLDHGLERLSISRTYGNFPGMRERHDRASVTVGQSLGGPLADDLRWRAFYQFGRTADEVRTVNIPRASHWLAARDVTADPASGRPVCRSATARTEGCLPLDVFSLAPPSPALLRYVLDTRDEKRTNTQHIWGATVVGEAFALPYGAASIAAGIEHRRETLETIDDPLAASELTYGGSGYSVHPELDEAVEVSEVYGELVIPVLRGLRFAERLELEGAYRYSRYSSVGGTSTWKLGGLWSPLAGIALRAVRSRSVRTPNFGELYEPAVSTQAGSITDPCEAGDYHQSATRAANCLALGIAVPLGDFKIGPLVTTSGNPLLGPETSHSTTLGIVLGHGLVAGLEATIDYWDIAIENVITQYDYPTVLNLCVDLPTIDNVFCDAVDRDATDGHVTAVRTSQINASKLFARGVDVGARYTVPLGPGRLELDLKGTYLLKHSIEAASGTPAGDVRHLGDWQHPRVKAALLASYRRGAFRTALDTRFISAGRFDVNASSRETYDDNSVPPIVYNDIYVSYDFEPRMSLLLGVRNALNTKPPYMFSVYRDGSIYDAVGRYFYLTVSGKL